MSLAFTYGAPNRTNTRLRNALAALALLLFTFVCAALYQGFARSGDYCEPARSFFAAGSEEGDAGSSRAAAASSSLSKVMGSRAEPSPFPGSAGSGALCCQAATAD